MNEPAGTQNRNFGPLEYPKGHPKYGQEHPQMTFLKSPADIAIFGGARGGSKTYALLLCALRHIKLPEYRAVMFRRIYSSIAAPGSMLPTSYQIYPWFGGKHTAAQWWFDSGAVIEFSHMQNKDDWLTWMGAQIPLICFDQLEEFEETQFISMLASNRDPSGKIKSYVRATCNPEPGWLANFIGWWIDKEGYPIAERSGALRWFVRANDKYVWADTKEALKSRYPQSSPMSVTFIPAFLEDNSVLEIMQPDYRGKILAGSQVQQERWLKGNWKVKPAAGMIFNRNWWNPAGKKSQIIDLAEIPAAMADIRWVRAWDLASTAAPADGSGGDPDWTAGVLMGKYAGQFFVKDVKRFRRSPKETEDGIRETAGLDGINVAIRMDEGANEKTVVSHYARNILVGYNFQGVPTQGHNKVMRAGPYASAVQAGNVFLIRGEWNADYIDELDSFQGLTEHNDQVDGSSVDFWELTQPTGFWDEGALKATFVQGGNLKPGNVEVDHTDNGMSIPHFTPRRL
jgi:predicted phage terminase large subunit-like protein